ncbi:hypothetical protein BWQ96_10227 [Gracilariopsis chorda]|uniref:Uncharacterized protein n=1 Tax=Gracilariopsis chorda TaxID=448386 RepID=A0A2V3IDE5_9FLOR|nr:hypothetical protein BWQ96_10227 [Gracilariopsis chorda]|eukprot:PXF40058.1 hypothetical protein BWQ96_10227 [Gracilariopsis chorda]
MFDAQAMHTTSAMEALTRTMKMLESAKTDEDRAVFENLLQQLKFNLATGSAMRTDY